MGVYLAFFPHHLFNYKNAINNDVKKKRYEHLQDINYKVRN